MSYTLYYYIHVLIHSYYYHVLYYIIIPMPITVMSQHHCCGQLYHNSAFIVEPTPLLWSTSDRKTAPTLHYSFYGFSIPGEVRQASLI